MSKSFKRHFQRKWGLLVGFLLVCMFLFYQVNTAKAAEPANSPTVHSKQNSMSMITSQKSPQGMPAIRATNGISRVQEIVTSPIRSDEVGQFVGSTYLPYMVHPAFPHVIGVHMMTSAALTQILKGEPTGFPDTKQLWVAEISGDFQYIGSGKGTSHHGYEIFDPDTGNLIMASFQ